MRPQFSAQDARRVTRVTQRCLDYWDERGIVRPSIRRGAGKGSVRAYSFRDLVKLSVVRHLRHAGLSLQKIQKALHVLRRRWKNLDPLADLRLITDGDRLHILTDDPAVLEDVLGQGQLVFSVVALGEIEKDVEKRAVRLEKRAV